MAIQIVPISNVFGCVKWGGAFYALDNWTVNLEVEVSEVKHFEMAADADSNYWVKLLKHFARASGQMSALASTGANQMLTNAPASIRAGLASGGTFLGLTPTLGILCTAFITGFQTGQDANANNGARFTWPFRIDGAPSYIVAPS